MLEEVKKDNQSKRWVKKQAIKKVERRIAIQAFQRELAEIDADMRRARSTFNPEHTVGLYHCNVR